MKKISLMIMATIMAMYASMVVAKPIYLVGNAWVDASDPMDSDGKKIVRYTIRYDNKEDMWHMEQVMFCADAKRDGCDGNVPIHAAKVNGLTVTWDIPLELIQWGQSGTNWANDSNWLDAIWLGLPDCNRLHVGKNLLIARSLADPKIEKSGGSYLLYVGPGAPYVPTKRDVLADNVTPVLYNGTGVCGERQQKTAVIPSPVVRQQTVAIEKQAISVDPCKITLTGDKERTSVLKSAIMSRWPNATVEVKIQDGSHKVVVAGSSVTEKVMISNDLLAKLKNPNGTVSFSELCPAQNDQILKVMGDCK